MISETIYDDRNNIIKGNYFETMDLCVEFSREFDNDKNIIYYKNSEGLEFWKKYNNKNKEIYYKNSYGIELFIAYDEKDKRIEFTNFQEYEKYMDEKIKFSIL